MIDPATLQSFPRLLSAARFGRYLEHAGGHADIASRLVAWNAEVTSAFWGPIAALEVFVRNAVHDAMRRDRRDDWWNDPTVCSMPRERYAIDGAVRTLERRGVSDPDADRVVAATSLGLWVGLTDAGVPRHPHLSYETALWQPRIAGAFPHRGSVRRKQLHRMLDEVRRLRNRLAHHEPVHDQALERVRDDIVRLAGFVDPDAASYVAQAHRIDDALARRDLALRSGRSVI